MTNYLNETFDLSEKNLVSVLDEFPLWSSYFGAVLLDMVDYKKNLTVLDIGCGTGFPMIELAQRLGSSSYVYGIDTWAAAAERIRLKIKTMNLNNAEILVQPAEQLPFEDNKFDLVVSNNGINNVQDPDKVLAECARTMKPGAQCILSMNLPGTMIEFYNVFRNTLINNGLKEYLPKVDEHIKFKRKTMVEYTGMIMQHPFCLEHLAEEKFYMRYSDGSSFLNHYVIKVFFMDSWKKIVPEDLLNIVFSETEAELNKLSEESGQLNLTIPFAVFKLRKILE